MTLHMSGVLAFGAILSPYRYILFSDIFPAVAYDYTLVVAVHTLTSYVIYDSADALLEPYR